MTGCLSSAATPTASPTRTDQPIGSTIAGPDCRFARVVVAVNAGEGGSSVPIREQNDPSWTDSRPRSTDPKANRIGAMRPGGRLLAGGDHGAFEMRPARPNARTGRSVPDGSQRQNGGRSRYGTLARSRDLRHEGPQPAPKRPDPHGRSH